jgi:hypothetical protein
MTLNCEERDLVITTPTTSRGLKSEQANSKNRQVPARHQGVVPDLQTHTHVPRGARRNRLSVHTQLERNRHIVILNAHGCWSDVIWDEDCDPMSGRPSGSWLWRIANFPVCP